MPDDPNLVHASLPTINVAGQDDADLTSNLLALVIDENTQGLYRCEATFGNWDVRMQPNAFLYFDRKKLDFGASAFATTISGASILSILNSTFSPGAELISPLEPAIDHDNVL